MQHNHMKSKIIRNIAFFVIVKFYNLINQIEALEMRSLKTSLRFSKINIGDRINIYNICKIAKIDYIMYYFEIYMITLYFFNG